MPEYIITAARHFHLSRMSDAERELEDLKQELIEKELDKLKAAQQKPNSIKQKNYEDIFAREEDAQESVNALRKVKPQIIDEKGAYCLGEKSKGAIVAFVAVLKKRSLIQHIPESELARILNKKFPQLKITDRSLRNLGTRVYRRYYNDLLALIK